LCLPALGSNVDAPQTSQRGQKLLSKIACQPRRLPLKFEYPHCQISMRVFVVFTGGFTSSSQSINIQEMFVGVSSSLVIRQPSVAGRAPQRWQQPNLGSRPYPDDYSTEGRR
jgi:predicted PP-loop superfamily ATPase